MQSLQQLRTGAYQVPAQKQRLLHEIAESKGRQQLFINQSPEILNTLLNYAIIESVRASTSMEGVVVPENARLEEMLSDSKWKPRDRDEEDVLAYKNAMDFIFSAPRKLELCVETILSLSNVLWAHKPELARLKRADNEIALVYPDGQRVVRFRPPSAKDSPELLERSCTLYHELCSSGEFVEHVVISAFILDFLCIHPLEDGNGQLGRLLHVLLLVQNGYEAPRFISHEGLIEKDKEGYYEALYKSSQGWNEGQHKANPWMNFSLGKLNLLYRRFESQIREAQKTWAGSVGRSESGQVEKALETITIGQTFERKDIEIRSEASGRTTRRVLSLWVKQGRLFKIGAGRGVRYKKLR